MTTPDIESVKDYWNARPCNIRHSQSPIGTLEYFEEVEKKKFYVEPHIITFSDFTNWKGKKVLEIGSGIGTVAINFARHGAHYTGVELSSQSMALTRKRFEVYNEQGTFYEGNAEELSSFVPVEKYDLIYSFGVIHHSPHPQKIIAELTKYMHKDTVLKIMLYSTISWKNYMIEAGLDQPEAQYGCPIAYTYTTEDVQELLAGFTILSCTKDHIFPYQIEPYKQGEYILQPWFAAMPKDMYTTLEKNLGWHTLITAKLNTTTP